MKSQIEILINSKVELTEGAFTINGEIEVSRKINRSIDNINHGYHYNSYEGFSLDTLLSMQKDNNANLKMLYDLKKENSAYKYIVPKVSNKYEVGAIVYDSWGYDQTNIDYYCIVKRTAQTVTLLKMEQHRSEEIGFMTNKETPLSIDFTCDPVSKKVKSYDGKETGFSMRNYSGGGWVSLWDGEEKTSTHYA